MKNELLPTVKLYASRNHLSNEKMAQLQKDSVIKIVEKDGMKFVKSRW